MFSSRIISSKRSAVMLPVRGFFTLRMAPFRVAYTLLYSKARSQSGAMVQFSITRSWA